MKTYYLDGMSAMLPEKKAVSALMPYLTDNFFDPSQPHKIAQINPPDFYDIYSLLEVDPKHLFVLTSSQAESINHALFSGYFDIMLPTGKNHFITSEQEIAPILLGHERLEKMGCVPTFVKPRKGQVDAETLADAITPRTAQITLSLANPLTGVVQPLTEIATLCEERGIRLVLDVSYAIGRWFFNFEDLQADIITFDGNLIGTPHGIGALFAKKETPFSPFIVGGDMQNHLRASPFNTGHLASLAAACRFTKENLSFVATETANLKETFEKTLLEGFKGATLLFKDQTRLPTTSAISFKGIAAEALAFSLSQEGVFVTIGGGNKQQITHLLKTNGIENDLANSAISFTLPPSLTEKDLQEASKIILQVAHKLRKLSTHII